MIAVVGAGIAGISAAQALRRAGHEVVLFDKGRRPGGRCSTRREGAHSFDHGAQYFTVRDPDFGRTVEGLQRGGVVRPWGGRWCTLREGELEPLDDGTLRWVGVPGMSALPQALGEGLDLRFPVRVTALSGEPGAWRLVHGEGGVEGPFASVLLCLPAPQAAALLAPLSALAALHARVQAVEMQPCWAVLAAFDASLPLPFDGAFVERSPLAWAARDSAKPGRPPGERWVLHAAGPWSAHHLEDDPQRVADGLVSALFAAVGRIRRRPTFLFVHRWRWARVEGGVDGACLHDPEAGVGLAGDWCAADGRIEGAWRSGQALARAILG
jgi:predicted NAD/FAD-dependent oxidoreductase